MSFRAGAGIHIPDRLTAFASGLILLAGWSPAGAASVQGVVLGPAGTPPAGGVRVEFRHLGTQRDRLSAGTDAAGRFVLPELSAGAYRWRVLGDGFVAEGKRPLVVEARHGTLPVEIRLDTLSESAASPGGHARPGPGTSGGGPWSRPVTATLIVLGAAIVVGVIVEAATDEEPVASPVAP